MLVQFMNNFFKNLQKKPLETRKKIMWINVFSLSLIIFLFWLLLAPHKPNNKNTSSISLSEFKEGMKEKVNESGIKNISGKIKEAAKEINSVSSKKNELEISEEPRLPLEIE